jgi:hypothetical protein
MRGARPPPLHPANSPLSKTDERCAETGHAIVERTLAEPWGQVILGALGTWAAALLVGPRSREAVLDGLKDAVRGRLDAAAKKVLVKAPGFVHTNETSEELLGALEYVARQEGKDGLVAQLKVLKAESKDILDGISTGPG